jgi:tetratricopeptide (TPR) repeat protein
MNEKLLLEANSLLSKGDFQKALKLYRELIGSDPQNALAYQNASVALGDLGNYHEALGMSEKAIEVDSSLVIPHITMAYIHDKLGNKEQSRKEAELALAKDPEMPEALSCMGIFSLMDNRFDDAKRYLEKAVKIKPSFYLAQDYLARVYQSSDSKQLFRQILVLFRLNPNFGNLLRLMFFGSRLYKLVQFPILLLSAFLSPILGAESILVITTLLMVVWFAGGIYIGFMAERKHRGQMLINLLAGIGIGILGLVIYLVMNVVLE